jgi:hypothetical protein
MPMRLLLSCLVLLLTACSEQSPPPKVKSKVSVGMPTDAALPVEKLKGTYTGEFRGSPISITLHYISGSRISGYNIHLGLKRNLSGTVSTAGGKLRLLLNEPGTNPYDGSFDLLLDTTTLRGQGTWKSSQDGKEVSFTFTKQVYAEEAGPLYSLFTDSLQNSIELNPDGSCIYNVMRQDSTAPGQPVLLRGNYELKKDSTVVIYWQQNEVLPSRKSVFRLYRIVFEGEEEDEYPLYGLKGEGKDFSQNFD